MRRTVFILMTAVLLVTACAPAESPQEVEARVATSVAQTVEAPRGVATSVAETVAALQPAATTTLAATGTAFPTFTPFPTVTPFTPVAGGGGGSGGGSGGSGSTSSKYSCAIVAEKPYDGATFKPGDSFDKTWTIKNTGTVTWTTDWEWEYISGTDMSETGDSLLPKNVKPDETITMLIEVQAPMIQKKDTGKIFVMKWSLNNGTHFCTPYVAIRVVYPGTNP